MRSEERAGIAAAVLLLLWGTVLTYPFHLFTVFLEDSVNLFCGKVLGTTHPILTALLTSVLMTATAVLLLILSKTGFAYFIPATALFVTSVSFIAEVAKTRTFEPKTGIALAVMLVITALLHLLKAERVILWEGDIFIYSICIHLLMGLVIAPLSYVNEVLRKILFVNHYNDTYLTAPFDGFLTLPAYAWGLFFMILLMLPVIYYSFSRRKA